MCQGTKPRQRFNRKAKLSGLDQSKMVGIVEDALDILTVWDVEGACFFKEVMIQQTPVQDLAAQLRDEDLAAIGKNRTASDDPESIGVPQLSSYEKRIRRILRGNDKGTTLGAEDKFILVLWLLWEASRVRTKGATTICASILLAWNENELFKFYQMYLDEHGEKYINSDQEFKQDFDWWNLPLGYHEKLTETYLEISLAVSLSELIVLRPWLPNGDLKPGVNSDSVCWPGDFSKVPSEKSQSPGVLAVLEHNKSVFELSCLTLALLWTRKQIPGQWENLLNLLNYPDSLSIARLGCIPEEKQKQALSATRLFLAGVLRKKDMGALAIPLLRTSIHEIEIWEEIRLMVWGEVVKTDERIPDPPWDLVLLFRNFWEY